MKLWAQGKTTTVWGGLGLFGVIHSLILAMPHWHSNVASANFLASCLIIFLLKSSWYGLIVLIKCKFPSRVSHFLTPWSQASFSFLTFLVTPTHMHTHTHTHTHRHTHLSPTTDAEESACKAGDLCSVPGLGRSPEKGTSSPLQYSGLENCMHRGVCRPQSMESQRAGHGWMTNTHTTFLPNRHLLGNFYPLNFYSQFIFSRRPFRNSLSNVTPFSISFPSLLHFSFSLLTCNIYYLSWLISFSCTRIHIQSMTAEIFACVAHNYIFCT